MDIRSLLTRDSASSSSSSKLPKQNEEGRKLTESLFQIPKMPLAAPEAAKTEYQLWADKYAFPYCLFAD